MRKLLGSALAVTSFLACGPGGMGGGSDAAPSLESGTNISATTSRTISSENDTPGTSFTARVSSDVKDGTGRVVIPAGATLHLKITALEAVRNSEKETAHVEVAVTSVEFADASYSLSGRVAAVPHTLKGQGLTTEQVGKTAVGAAAGGVIGRVVGGNKTGTAVGAVVGGAAGAVVSKNTGESDVVVAAGTPIVVTLDDAFKAH